MGDLGELRHPRKLLVVLSCDKMRNVLQQLRGKHPQQCHHWVQWSLKRLILFESSTALPAHQRVAPVPFFGM